MRFFGGGFRSPCVASLLRSLLITSSLASRALRPRTKIRQVVVTSPPICGSGVPGSNKRLFFFCKIGPDGFLPRAESRADRDSLASGRLASRSSAELRSQVDKSSRRIHLSRLWMARDPLIARVCAYAVCALSVLFRLTSRAGEFIRSANNDGVVRPGAHRGEMGRRPRAQLRVRGAWACTEPWGGVGADEVGT